MDIIYSNDVSESSKWIMIEKHTAKVIKKNSLKRRAL